MTNATGMPLTEAQAIVDALREPPRWMTNYLALPEYCRFIIDHFDQATSDALLDELLGLLLVDDDQLDRTNACNAFAVRWSAVDLRIAQWWYLVRDWLDRDA